VRAKKIYESLDFQKGLDPKVAMGIGQKVAIEKWFDDFFEGYPPEWKLNADGTIDLLEDFSSPDKKIHAFPDFIQFNVCHGDFMIDCCEMESLRGCPKKVIGYFSCEQNNLMSLDGMPETVFGDIFVRDNPGHFKKSDVLEKTANLSQRKIYSEDSHVDESYESKRVYEFVNFMRAGSDASAAEILKNAGVGRSVVTITWGKHRGKTVGDVFNEDPQYIVWLAKEGRPRPGQEAVFDEIHRLADKHLADLEKKREDEGYGFHYGRPGDIFEGPIEVRSARFYSGDYGSAYQIIGKYPPGQGQAKHWIRFYANLNILEKLFNLTGEEDSGYKLRDKMANLPGKIIDVKGKVTKHTEYKGQKTTNLNYVKFPKPLTESLDFERGMDPKSALKIGTIEVLKNQLAELAEKYDLLVIDDRSERNGYIWWYDAVGNIIKLHWNKKDRVPIMIIENTEDGYEKIIGFENIRDYIQSGELDEFFFYEG